MNIFGGGVKTKLLLGGGVKTKLLLGVRASISTYIDWVSI